MSRPRLMVVGVGNRHRGDDGIGPAVVDAIRADTNLAGIDTVVAAGDLSDLVVTWTSDHDVIIVDAMVGGGDPGSIRTINGLDGTLPAAGRPLSSHGFGLVDTLELARLLGRLPRTVTILAVELDDTADLAQLTGRVRRAVDEVVARIVEVSAGGPAPAPAPADATTDTRSVPER